MKVKFCLLSTLYLIPLFSHGSNQVGGNNWEKEMDLFFGEYIVSPLAAILFWPIPGIEMPLVVAWLLGGVPSFLPCVCAL